MNDYKENFEINKYLKDIIYNSFYLDYLKKDENFENKNLNLKIKTCEPEYNNEDNVFSSLR
jgi:hypothetical protein